MCRCGWRHTSQEVRITANATMVETQDTSISEVVNQRRIIDLPLNGRQATQLILLTGGARARAKRGFRRRERDRHHQELSRLGGFSVGGGPATGNNYVMDGADNNDSFSNVNLPFPFPDALQEFSVQTNAAIVGSLRAPSRFGAVNVDDHKSPGPINFMARFSNLCATEIFNARNFFAPTQDTCGRNQFGGTMGGAYQEGQGVRSSRLPATPPRTAPPHRSALSRHKQSFRGGFNALESAGCQSTSGHRAMINPSHGQPLLQRFRQPEPF